MPGPSSTSAATSWSWPRAASDALEWDSERSQGGKAPRDWLRSKGNSIEGGTSEIQLNIVAKHILRLPGA